MIDVEHQINEVRREVGNRVLEAGEARVVTVSQVYRGSLDELWDAVTNPERLPRWFAPVSGDLRLGGRFQIEGNASGTIEHCDPPRGFSTTWEYGDEVSWLEVRLSEESADRVRFTLEHVAHVDDERWAEFGPGAVGMGWDLALLGLAQYRAGEEMAADEAAAWMASAEAHRFLSLSSDGWCRASVAAGTPEAEAQAAADQCLAFYTGASTPE